MAFTLREQLRKNIEFIGFEHIDCLLFTTYNFNPEFFENNILPVVFDIDSPSAIQRKIQVNENLLKSPCAVLYDSNTQPTNGGDYYYQKKGISFIEGCFHPKNIVIAGYKQERPFVLVSASSANLSFSGWARNHEAYSFISINTKNQESYRSLSKFFKYLEVFQTKGKVKAITKMLDFLKKMPSGNVSHANLNGQLYFSINQKKGKGFPEFLGSSKQYRKEKLTIVSPYWSENIISILKQFNVAEYCLKPAYFEKKNTWGLNNTQVNELGKSNNIRVEKFLEKIPRFRHAKVYLLYNYDSVKIGIGSCNFTSSGLSGTKGNIESMIVYKIDRQTAEYFDPPCPKIKFEDYNNILEPEESAIDKPPFLINISYDWMKKTMEIEYEAKHGVIFEYCKLYVDDLEIDLCVNSLSPRYFTPKEFNYSVKYKYESDIEKIFKGIIFEFNLESSDKEYFSKMSLQDIFSSWSLPEGEWKLAYKVRSISDSEEEEEEEVVEKETDNLDFFKIYQSFRRLFIRIRNMNSEEAVKLMFNSPRPDSLKNLLIQIHSSELDIVTKFIAIKEIEFIWESEKERFNGISGFGKLLNPMLIEVRDALKSTFIQSNDSKIFDPDETIRWFEKELKSAQAEL